MNVMTQNRKSITPILLFITIIVFIIFLAWSARQASTGGTDVTDSDYYSKGLKYNSTLVEKRAASVIGWSLHSSLHKRLLTLILTNKDNARVAGAHASASFPLPGSNQYLSVPFPEVDPGTYQLTIPGELSGEQLVRVEFERDGARISRQLLLNIEGT